MTNLNTNFKHLQKKNKMYQNQLVNESSLYLQQHASNPVHWQSWSSQAFDEAKAQNKLVLVSIGYSSCHWCHVMEKECFEDKEVAQFLNKHFVNIKVDKEERPDIDLFYMKAVQLMTQRGGWPLNCFTLPDGRPIYGGTYFPKTQWMQVLQSLLEAFKNESKRVEEYAQKLNSGMLEMGKFVPIEVPTSINIQKTHTVIAEWSKTWDMEQGGMMGAPKFPLPSNGLFILRYGRQFKNLKALDFIKLSLLKMARGGIFDQIGGGFARYSVDAFWKVPHFEKMLYDNGQLLQLYAEAYSIFKDKELEYAVYKTVTWLENEMQLEIGAFSSSMDADSEGEEGKYYCWEMEELNELNSEDRAFVLQYYSIKPSEIWEENKYILHRQMSDDEFSKNMGVSKEEFLSLRNRINQRLFSMRQKRISPTVDTKVLTAWNALVVKGYIASYRAFQKEHFLSQATALAEFILERLVLTNGLKRRYSEEGLYSEGFLEDYAHVIEAFIEIYQAEGSLKWLLKAKDLCEYVETHFQDQKTKLCYFSKEDSILKMREYEVNDNVLPSSNAVMAMNFLKLGHYFKSQKWMEDSRSMLSHIYEGMEDYGSGYSYWSMVLMLLENGMNTVQVDTEFMDKSSVFLNSSWRELVVYHQELPLYDTNLKEGIYICGEGRCSPKISSIESLREMLKL